MGVRIEGEQIANTREIIKKKIIYYQRSGEGEEGE
jgi:hypothetical protein